MLRQASATSPDLRAEWPGLHEFTDEVREFVATAASGRPADAFLPPHLGLAVDPGECRAGCAARPRALFRADRARRRAVTSMMTKGPTTCRRICARADRRPSSRSRSRTARSCSAPGRASSCSSTAATRRSARSRFTWSANERRIRQGVACGARARPRLIEVEESTATVDTAAKALASSRAGSPRRWRSARASSCSCSCTRRRAARQPQVQGRVRRPAAHAGRRGDVRADRTSGRRRLPVRPEKPLPVYLDVSLKAFDVVYPAGGSLNTSVEVPTERLFELVGERWVDLCRLPEEPAGLVAPR